MFKLLENVSELVLALYRRVSTDKQADEGYSLDVQLEKLQAYAKTLSNVKEVRVIPMMVIRAAAWIVPA